MVFRPTPLKNDGRIVSWDDEIPWNSQDMEKWNSCSKPPTSFFNDMSNRKIKKKTALLSNTTQVPHSWLHKLPQFLDEHPITSQHVDHFAEISIGFLLKKTENLSYPPSFAAFTGTGVLVVSLYLSFISPTLVARSIFFRWNRWVTSWFLLRRTATPKNHHGKSSWGPHDITPGIPFSDTQIS